MAKRNLWEWLFGKRYASGGVTPPPGSSFVINGIEEKRRRNGGSLFPDPPPVDRDARTLTDGSPVPEDGSHTEDRGDGQQKGYVVLSAEERAKGFKRPVRHSYVHDACGTLTTMGQALAETYARSPSFYSGTFCCGCGAHFPVGEDGEFVWDGTDERVGT